MASPCGEHDQIGLLLLDLLKARAYRIALGADFDGGYSEFVENLKGMTPRLQQIPLCEGLAHGRKPGPIFPLAPARMHDHQLRLPKKRDSKRVRKRKLARLGKIGGMENGLNEGN
jgi:hypothetical protein